MLRKLLKLLDVRSSDVIIALAIVGLGLTIASQTYAQDVGNDIPVLMGEDLPMDGDFTEDGSSVELVPPSEVQYLLCDPFVGCDGKGDFASPRPITYVVCIQEDDFCSGPLFWSGVQDFVDQYQDAGIDIYEEGSREYRFEVLRQMLFSPDAQKPLRPFPEYGVTVASR